MDTTEDKEAKYNLLLKQVKSIIHKEPNFMANLCNIVSLLKKSFNFFWVGTYFVEKKDLVLGPFQGPPACSRIPKGKGVCGRSWEEEISFVVPDVNDFPGHISCNPQSKSEIVIPIKTKDDKIFMVLDIDSDKLDDLDQSDLLYLEKVATILQEIYPKNAQY